MNKTRIARGLVLLSALAAGLASLPGQAAASVFDTSTCAAQPESQPFLSWKDKNWYTPFPGQSQAGFEGTGWTLSGGAGIVTTTLPDGSTGSVLDLPSGSRAVSPVACVTSDFPTARTMIRNVVGAEGVFFYVSYAGDSAWSQPKNTGQVHGKGTGAWTLSDPINLQPDSDSGWQPLQMTFVAGGKMSEFQIYNAWLDPRMK